MSSLPLDDEPAAQPGKPLVLRLDVHSPAALRWVLDIRRQTGDAPHIVARAAFEFAKALMAGGPRPAERARAVALGHEARSLWEQDAVPEKVRGPSTTRAPTGICPFRTCATSAWSC